MLAHASELSVRTFLCVAIDLDTLSDVLAIAEKYPDVEFVQQVAAQIAHQPTPPQMHACT